MSHFAIAGIQMIPVEVDFAMVRRQRRRGLEGMGQPLKSFRDSTVDFAIYRPEFDRSYLDSLGPLPKNQVFQQPVNAPQSRSPSDSVVVTTLEAIRATGADCGTFHICRHEQWPRMEPRVQANAAGVLHHPVDECARDQGQSDECEETPGRCGR